MFGRSPEDVERTKEFLAFQFKILMAMSPSDETLCSLMEHSIELCCLAADELLKRTPPNDVLIKIIKFFTSDAQRRAAWLRLKGSSPTVEQLIEVSEYNERRFQKEAMDVLLADSEVTIPTLCHALIYTETHKDAAARLLLSMRRDANDEEYRNALSLVIKQGGEACEDAWNRILALIPTQTELESLGQWSGVYEHRARAELLRRFPDSALLLGLPYGDACNGQSGDAVLKRILATERPTKEELVWVRYYRPDSAAKVWPKYLLSKPANEVLMDLLRAEKQPLRKQIWKELRRRGLSVDELCWLVWNRGDDMNDSTFLRLLLQTPLDERILSSVIGDTLWGRRVAMLLLERYPKWENLENVFRCIPSMRDELLATLMTRGGFPDEHVLIRWIKRTEDWLEDYI